MAIVDTTALWQTIVAAFLAGVGVTFTFSIAVFGVARFVELGRDGRSAAAVAFAAVATVAVLVVGAAVVLGVIVMTSK